MYILLALYLAVLVALTVFVSRRVRRVNARLRANLAGCKGYPLSESSRRPATPLDPLRVGQSRAAERSCVVRT